MLVLYQTELQVVYLLRVRLKLRSLRHLLIPTNDFPVKKWQLMSDTSIKLW